MIFDVIIIVIILYGAIRGFRRGFSSTIFSLIGWIISVLGAFLLTPFIKSSLLENTQLGSYIIPDSTALSMVPSVISDTVIEATTNLVFTMITYTIVFIAIKLVMWLLITLITRHDRKSFIGVIDGLFGMIFGIIKGAVVACVFIALLLPVTDMLIPSMVGAVETLLDSSYIASYVYNENPIYMLLETFIIK